MPGSPADAARCTVRPAASRPATCKATSRSCRKIWPRTSCASVRRTPSRARSSVSQTLATRACRPAGPFAGPMVVSMRPLTPANAIRAIQITSRFPAVHGAPVHVGLPALIGIKDIAKPDHGDAVEVRPDELPVFWACGVTPQAVIAAVKPPFAITHAPGSMLVTDLQNRQFALL